MLCDELNIIYLNYIHINLYESEFIYSAEVKETFLDMWKSVTDVKQLPDNDSSDYYFRGNKILFEVYSGKNMFEFTFDVFEIYLPLRDKYKIEYYAVISIVRNIVEKHIFFRPLNICLYEKNNELIEKKFLENAL